MDSHYIIDFKQMQNTIPCIGRGDIELKYNKSTESACCKEKGVVESSRFYCTILSKYIYNANICWTCNKRK